ncbi:molecular chaperone DnaJ [Marinobacter salicampi]|uniref:molecular chaperone DnaJ n=1 Tax=Marinobacter salicampi TaxID=435907 RepID=UPI00140E1AEE|nr:molecular chaperone DnaJ [Marinobacter salicampi]
MHWLLGIGLTLLVFVTLKYWAGLAPEQRKTVGWKVALAAAGLLLLGLVLTGRVHILVAAVAALLPMLRRLPVLLKYLPALNRLFRTYKSHGQQRSAGEGPGRQVPPVTGSMSVSEACEVLGVKPGCAEDEVVMAHRRLMQKLHPDRGGTDYLAAKLNEAKTVLLGRRGS